MRPARYGCSADIQGPRDDRAALLQRGSTTAWGDREVRRGCAAGVTRVKLVVWRCYGTGFSSGFRVVETLHARVASTGAFNGSFAVNVHSDCFAQAAYVGGHSRRVYFRVR